MRVVRAGARDLPRILAIERACFGRDAWTETLFRAYLAAQPALFFIAKDGTRTAGYSVAIVRGDRAEIESIAVDPRWRRRGIGSTLLRKTAETLRRRGISALSLIVNQQNRAAIALYRRFAFRRTRSIRDYYGAGRHGWRMSASLERKFS